MTRQYYLDQIKSLEQGIVQLGEGSMDLMALSLKSLVDQDVELAKKVLVESEMMAEREVELENDCIDLLALQQPMASDLRFISTGLKILTDMGRLSRMAWDIAHITIKIQKDPLLPQVKDILEMSAIAESMVRDSLKAFVNKDVELAMTMSTRDDTVDAMYDHIRRSLIDEMIKNPSAIDMASHLSFVARFIERAGDHACVIASRTVYMVTGTRVRIR